LKKAREEIEQLKEELERTKMQKSGVLKKEGAALSKSVRFTD